MNDSRAETGKIRWPQPLQGLRGVRRADLPREVSNGLTLAALVIPLNIGYAQVAGLPAVMGLHAALFPLILFALFTSSRHWWPRRWPDSPCPAILAGFSLPWPALALLCAALFFLAWFFRLGFLQTYLSRAVLVGFVSGLGVQVFTSQLWKILGVSADTASQFEQLSAKVEEAAGFSLKTEGYFLDLIALVKEVPNANLYTLAIGLGSLVMVRLLKRFAPRVPGALAVLVLMTLVVVGLGLDKKGVSVLGQLPSGLPALAIPSVPLNDYLRLLPGAVALVAITLAEGLLVVRSYAQKHRYKVDNDEVLFAYGMANLSAGVAGSMVTGNSVSRSAAMDSAGGRSQLSSLVAAGVVGVVLLFFTDVLALLPNAALAGIVANAVISLVAIADLRAFYRTRRSEFWIAVTCLLAVLIVGPLRAVIIAFLLSIIDLLRRASRPYTTVLEQAPDGHSFIPVDFEGTRGIPGLIVYRFGASLFFANAGVFSDEIDELIDKASSPVQWFVLDADAMGEMDTAGAETLEQVILRLTERGITFAIARAHRPLRELLSNYELLDRIGPSRMYLTNRHAAEAFGQDQDGASQGD